MKLPAEGSPLANSATAKASRTTATPPARTVSGAAPPCAPPRRRAAPPPAPPRGEARPRPRHARGDRDHAEGEVEVDPRPDVRDRRGRHVRRAQLPAPQAVRGPPHP